MLLSFIYSSIASGQQIDSDSPIEIISDRVKYKADINKIYFEGKVVATQKDLKLYCDQMEALFEKKQPNNIQSNNKLKTIYLFGNVVITTPKDRAYSNRGVYEVDDEKLTLKENVRLEQDNNVLHGDELTYFKATGESILKNSPNNKQRVRGTFSTKNIK